MVAQQTFLDTLEDTVQKIHHQEQPPASGLIEIPPIRQVRSSPNGRFPTGIFSERARQALDGGMSLEDIAQHYNGGVDGLSPEFVAASCMVGEVPEIGNPREYMQEFVTGDDPYALASLSFQLDLRPGQLQDLFGMSPLVERAERFLLRFHQEESLISEYEQRERARELALPKRPIPPSNGEYYLETIKSSFHLALAYLGSWYLRNHSELPGRNLTLFAKEQNPDVLIALAVGIRQFIYRQKRLEETDDDASLVEPLIDLGLSTLKMGLSRKGLGFPYGEESHFSKPSKAYPFLGVCYNEDWQDRVHAHLSRLDGAIIKVLRTGTASIYPLPGHSMKKANLHRPQIAKGIRQHLYGSATP